MDEQFVDARAAAALHHPFVGYVSGRVGRIRRVPVVRVRRLSVTLARAAAAGAGLSGERMDVLSRIKKSRLGRSFLVLFVVCLVSICFIGVCVKMFFVEKTGHILFKYDHSQYLSILLKTANVRY